MLENEASHRDEILRQIFKSAGVNLFKHRVDLFFAFLPRTFYKSILVESECYIIVEKYHNDIVLFFNLLYIVIPELCDRSMIGKYDFIILKFG